MGSPPHPDLNRLENLGHHVIGTCGTAAEAIEQAADAEIVLMDIRLDGPGDGIAAASRSESSGEPGPPRDWHVWDSGGGDRAGRRRGDRADGYTARRAGRWDRRRIPI